MDTTIKGGAAPHSRAASSQQTLLRARRSRMSEMTEVAVVMLPAIVIFAIGAQYHGFIEHAIAANPALNYTILGVLVIGIVAMLRAMLYVGVQRRGFVAWFDAQSDKEAQKTWKRTFGFSVVGESLKRMFDGSAARDAEGLRLAVDNEVEAVTEQLDTRLEFAAYLVGGMVAMGLLGTFIGLLETLVSISSLVTGVLAGLNSGGAVEQAITQMVGQLRGPLNSMATAFSASMFGVTGSVVLGLILVLVRRRTSAFIEVVRHDAHDYANELISRHHLVDENKLTTGFLRQHLGAVVEALGRQTQNFEHVANESVRTEARIAAAVESMDRVASVYGDLASRLLAIDGMIVQLREMSSISGLQLECSRQTQGTLSEVLATSQASQEGMLQLSEQLSQLAVLSERGVDRVTETIGDLSAGNERATREAVSAVIEGVGQRVDELAIALAPISDIHSCLQVIESLFAQASEEGMKREQRSTQSAVRLVGTLQVLKDTVSALAVSQEGDMRQVMARLERHIVELKGFGAGSEAFLKALTQKATESTSVLGRHTALFEGMRVALDTKRTASDRVASTGPKPDGINPIVELNEVVSGR